MAKLGSQAPAQPLSPTSTGSSSKSDSHATPGVNLQSQNPFAQISTKQASSDGPRISVSSTGARQPPSKQQGTASSISTSAVKAEELLEVWEDRILRTIFRLTLNADTKQDSLGHTLHYIGSVHDDLEEQNESIRMSTTILDQAILEAASNLGKATPLDYLLGCWKRVTRQFKQFKAGKSEDPKYTIIKEARRLCMSYCIFAITMPDMFG